jgi:hypothetical protein
VKKLTNKSFEPAWPQELLRVPEDGKFPFVSVEAGTQPFGYPLENWVLAFAGIAEKKEL